MNNIFKICLILALFFSSVSVAWAGLNYDSVNNFFLIDSILKTEGAYFLVGESLSGYCTDGAEPETVFSEYLTISQCESAGKIWLEELRLDVPGESTDSFFSISNNLIFLGVNSAFMGGNREIRDGIFATNTITVQNPVNDFEILSDGGSLKINFKNPAVTNQVIMNQDLIINNGLSLIADQDTANRFMSHQTVLADKVLANELKLLTSDQLAFRDGSVLTVSAGGGTEDSVSFIKVVTAGDVEDDFCVKIPFPDAVSASTANVFPTSKILSDTNVGISCDDDGGSQGNSNSIQLACCPKGYYVFDIDVQLGKMVCCQYSQVNPLP